MLKKSFFSLSLSKPRFRYETMDIHAPNQMDIPIPETITLYLKDTLYEKSTATIQVGDLIKTGQKISLSEESTSYAISSLSGTVESIAPVISNYGAPYTAISIKTSDNEEFDKTFEGASSKQDLETIVDFLATCPGEPPVNQLLSKNPPVDTILICSGNMDLMINDSLHTAFNNSKMINYGVNILKTATGIENVLIVVPENTIQSYSGLLDASIKVVPSYYPHAQPLMIEYGINGKLPCLTSKDSSSLCFFKFEAIESIGSAFKNKTIPLKKNILLVDKEGLKYSFTVAVGTHVNHIIKALNLEIRNGDRIIFGGPMTGSTIYGGEHPILPDTDLILIQDKTSVSHYSDYPCINCGECIRACPTNVPVNLLVRFLEAGQYEDGADLYDLYSCIDCGLCSYVCVSKIPIFQYIKLAKYELNRNDYMGKINE